MCVCVLGPRTLGLCSEGSGRRRQLGPVSCESGTDSREPGSRTKRRTENHQEAGGRAGARHGNFFSPSLWGVAAGTSQTRGEFSLTCSLR